MIVIPINENEHIIKIDECNIDIFEKKEVETLIRSICGKVYHNRKIAGLLYLDIYINKYDELIILSNYNQDNNEDIINVKITFHIDSDFLYEVGNIDNIDITKYKIYYYKDKYYLNSKSKLNIKDIYILSEIGNIIIGSKALEIKTKGISIK